MQGLSESAPMRINQIYIETLDSLEA